jgi:hypothetical protein
VTFTSLAHLVIEVALLGLVIGFIARASQRHSASFHTTVRAAYTGSAGRLVERHLQRTDWFRRFGARAGLGFAVEIGSIWYGRFGFGVGSQHLLADALAMPMVGSLLGSIAAETYNLHPRFHTTARVADLTDRRHRYRDAAAAHQVRLWSILAIIAGSAAAAHQRSPVIVLTACVVFALVEATARAVEARSRPILPADMRAADDSIRYWATYRVDRAGYGIGILLTAWGVLGSGIGGVLSPVPFIWNLAMIAVAWWSLIASFSIWRSITRIPA